MSCCVCRAANVVSLQTHMALGSYSQARKLCFIGNWQNAVIPESHNVGVGLKRSVSRTSGFNKGSRRSHYYIVYLSQNHTVEDQLQRE